MSLENKSVKDKISIIINYFQVRNFDKLIEEANRLLAKNPNIDILWNILGLTYQKLGNYDEAEKKFFRALQVNSNNISAINNLGNNYKYTYKFKKAENCFQKALDGNSQYIPSLINFGNLKFEFNKFDEALSYFKKALEIDDKLPTIHLNISQIYQSLGDFKKATFHLKKINQLEPKLTQADKMQSALINYKNDTNHLFLMEDKLKKMELNDNEKIQLYFALSKAYEDKLNFSKAFQYFEDGNRLKRSQSNYNIDKDKRLFKSIKKFFNNSKLDTANLQKFNKNIIFILGMPRSGTTLVEQIISSHKDVFGAGEIGYLSKLIYKNFSDKNNNLFNDNIMDQEVTVFKNIANEYHSYISNFNFEHYHITDKALLNFQWIGFIKILFPNAKIINCLRNQENNCLSIYKNLFEHEGAWCYDKKELSEFYELYLDLMRFWKKKFPDSIYEVQYEDLVSNSEKSIKKLINYLDIGWDENCLKFYQNKNAIKTLSVNQARKEIYTSSVDVYDNYKPYLKNCFG